jgi:drug/metabolite transporter (DMT)-like permease
MTIILTSWLLISFRVFGKMGVDNLNAIIINYWVCVLTGLLYPGNATELLSIREFKPWMLMAFITGACFLPTFFLMSYTVKNVSVTVATLAIKTSLVLPVMVSLVFLVPGQKVSASLWIGLVLGLGAIVLSSVRKEESGTPVSWKTYLLPAIVFLGSAMVDILVNISNTFSGINSTLFPLLAFSSSAITGGILMAVKWRREKIKLDAKTWFAGLILGIPNFLSILFLLRTLDYFNNNGAIVFPVVNISIIVLNTVVGIFVFKEKASTYTIGALLLALVALVLVLQNG